MPGPGMAILTASLAAVEGRVDQGNGRLNIRRQPVVDELGVMVRDIAARDEGKQRRPAGIALVERDARAGSNRVRREHAGSRRGFEHMILGRDRRRSPREPGRSEERRVGKEGVRTLKTWWGA